MATPSTGRRRFGQRLALRVLLAAGVGVVAPLVPASPASAADYNNPAPIALALPGPPPGCPFPDGCPSEKATPFPSNIAVSGATGNVTDVNVTLRDLTYEFKPADADILLVAPDNKAVMLMSDACGDNENENAITTPITLTFDDQAGAQLPADARCVSGSFRPLDDDDDEGEFPLHGHGDDAFPGGPTPPAITLPLSTFNGINPNGTWALFVVDDYPNDPNPSGTAGRIAGGWTLAINTSGGGTASTAPGNTTLTTPATTATPVANPSVTVPPGTTLPGVTSSPNTVARTAGPVGTSAPPATGGASPASGGASNPASNTGAGTGTGTGRVPPGFGGATTAAGQPSTAGGVGGPRTSLPNSGRNDGVLFILAATMIATGYQLIKMAEERRRPRRRPIYVVHYTL